MITSQARSPRTTNAVRQSYWSISHRASGDRVRIPKPLPAETTAAAIARRSSNHLMAVTASGT